MRALAFTSVLAVACGGSSPRAPASPAVVGNAAPEAACLADRVPASVPPAAPWIDCAGTESACRSACDDGEAVMCLSLGHTVQQDESRWPDAAQLYRRACELGDLSGCVNYGAYLLEGLGGLTADPACAARLHERACQGDDPYGCGMFGHALALGVGVARDPARARELLETSCAELGNFACLVLGRHLEGGELGAVDPAGAAAAYRRACETDVPESCELAEQAEGSPP